MKLVNIVLNKLIMMLTHLLPLDVLVSIMLKGIELVVHHFMDLVQVIIDLHLSQHCWLWDSHQQSVVFFYTSWEILY
jgi:hypothetical protein